MDGLIIGYMAIFDDPLARAYGGNLELIWAQKMFFCLILREFCNFSVVYDFCRNFGF